MKEEPSVDTNEVVKEDKEVNEVVKEDKVQEERPKSRSASPAKYVYCLFTDIAE